MLLGPVGNRRLSSVLRHMHMHTNTCKGTDLCIQYTQTNAKGTDLSVCVKRHRKTDKHNHRHTGTSTHSNATHTFQPIDTQEKNLRGTSRNVEQR